MDSTFISTLFNMDCTCLLRGMERCQLWPCQCGLCVQEAPRGRPHPGPAHPVLGGTLSVRYWSVHGVPQPPGTTTTWNPQMLNLLFKRVHMAWLNMSCFCFSVRFEIKMFFNNVYAFVLIRFVLTFGCFYFMCDVSFEY